MSLYIDLQVNNDPITSIGITRISTGGTQPDSVNTYRWVHYHDQGQKTEGELQAQVRRWCYRPRTRRPRRHRRPVTSRHRRTTP